MPNDDVFDPQQDGGETPPTPKEPAAQKAAPPSNLSKDDVDAAVARQIDPIKESLAQMNQFFAKLQEQATSRVNEPDDSGNGKDWGTEFYNDPQGTVQREVNSLTAPVLQQAAGTMGKMLLEQQQTAIDREFGDGTWKEVFAPKLDPIVAEATRQNPTSLMNPTAIKNAVDTIKGNNFTTLVQRAQKALENTSNPNEELVNAAANKVVELTGGIRRVSGKVGEKLDDPDSKEFLRTFFQATGEEPDVGRLSKLMSVGHDTGDRSSMTYDDWKKATQEAK